jgi:hypothetical protein
MWKHSLGACSSDAPLDPKDYINSQADIIVRGILAVSPSNLPAHSTLNQYLSKDNL